MSSKIQTKYKGNAITTELYRTKSTATDFNMQTDRIKMHFLDVGFLLRFVKKTIRNFDKEKNYP